MSIGFFLRIPAASRRLPHGEWVLGASGQNLSFMYLEEKNA
jgi:hypothetical protein